MLTKSLHVEIGQETTSYIHCSTKISIPILESIQVYPRDGSQAISCQFGFIHVLSEGTSHPFAIILSLFLLAGRVIASHHDSPFVDLSNCGNMS